MAEVIWADQDRLDLEVMAGNCGALTVGAVVTDEGSLTVAVVGNGTAVDIRIEEGIPEAHPEDLANTAHMVLATNTAIAGVALDSAGVEGLVSLVNRANLLRRAAALRRARTADPHAVH